ncbi:MAG: hypothetical protein KJO07_00585 [Deltaproteobacteria bacterium]|nr:hypothetical protein [Deltaproteobacteria bacterium]
MKGEQTTQKHSAIRIALGLGVGLLACSGGAESGSTEPTPPKSDPADDKPAKSQSAWGKQTAVEDSNHPPDFELPHYRRVGVGQKITFGLEMIDEDQDEVKVELIGKPDSAKYDPLTLTVSWKPTRRDLPMGQFKVKMTETQRKSGKQRVFIHDFSIDVDRRRVALPEAGSLSPAVETLITIHDKERLKLVNKQWPLHKLLAWSAASKLKDLPEAEQTKLAKIDGKVLYKDLLKNLAKANHNPTVHPETGAFDKKAWGDPKGWKIIAVRPRLDKNWHEMRVVYKNEKADPPTYVMFKIRPVSDANLPEEAREYNNKVFSKLVAEAFFDVDGNLDPKLMTNKRAHAKKVQQLFNGVLDYEDPDKKWAHGTFLGLPCEARLGGGSKIDSEGNYVSGDGWGWNVLKVKPADGRMKFKNVPIKGFATKVVAKAGGWKMACAKPFGKGGEKRFEGLCRDSGHVDLPAGGDGYSDPGADTSAKRVPSFVDAANLFLDYKDQWMTKELPLRDPRRDIFEEKGLTCSQCHVRKFGVRDMYDKKAYDSSNGAPTAMNKSQAPTFFVITPTVSWQPYAIDFQNKQLCKFKKALKKDIGLKTSLVCPLMAE